jgi:hypothetical protein
VAQWLALRIPEVSGHYAKKQELIRVRFQVLVAPGMKITVFWDVAQCSLVVDQRFRGASIIVLMMEAASTSETLVNFYQTTEQHPRRQ